MDWIGCGSEYTWSSWIGLDWVSQLVDWVGLDLAKWTHVQLCVKCYSYCACTSATVSGGGRNATAHDPTPYI